MKKLMIVLLCIVSVSLCSSFKSKNDFKDIKWKAVDGKISKTVDTYICFNSTNYKYEFHSIYNGKDDSFDFGDWERKKNDIIIKFSIFDTYIKKDTIHIVIYTIKKITNNEMVLYDNKTKQDIIFKRI